MGLVLACREDVRGKRVQCRLAQDKTSGSRAPAEKGGVSTGSLKDRVSLVRKAHAWMVGEMFGSRCTTSRESCRCFMKQSRTRRKSCGCPLTTEKRSLIEERDIIGESVIFLKQYCNKTMERLQERGDIRDEAEGWQKLKDLPGKINGEICRELRRSASGETRSYVQGEITVEDVNNTPRTHSHAQFCLVRVA